MAPKAQKGPIRVGEGPFEHPGEGKGAVGAIAKKFNISFEEATKRLGAAMGDMNKVMNDGVSGHPKHTKTPAMQRTADHPHACARLPFFRSVERPCSRPGVGQDDRMTRSVVREAARAGGMPCMHILAFSYAGRRCGEGRLPPSAVRASPCLLYPTLAHSSGCLLQRFTRLSPALCLVNACLFACGCSRSDSHINHANLHS